MVTKAPDTLREIIRINLKMISIKTTGDKSPGAVGGDYVDNSINTNVVRNYFLFQHGLLKTISSIMTRLRHHLNTKQISYEELADYYFNNSLHHGQSVTVHGFLSKYVLTYRHNYYSPYTHRTGQVLRAPTYNKQETVKMEIKSQVTQLPIQTFPHFTKENKQKYIYFLYHPSFKSFHTSKANDTTPASENTLQNGCILDINESLRPIVLISPKNLEQFCNNYIKVTALINTFDPDITKLFFSQLNEPLTSIFSNTFRPYNESNISLCLDLSIDPSQCMITTQERITSLPATLYVETHFDNINSSKTHLNSIGGLLPKAYPGLHWVSFGEKGTHDSKVKFGLCDSSTSIATVNFVNFAHYTDVDIVSTDFSDKLKALKDSIELFRKNVCRFYKKTYNSNIRHVYDFIFDYKREYLFHPEGIMSSGSLAQEIKEDNELSVTLKWLKSQSI